MLTMEALLEKARAGGYRTPLAASRGWGSGRSAPAPLGHPDTPTETPIVPQAAVRAVQSLLPASAPLPPAEGVPASVEPPQAPAGGTAIEVVPPVVPDDGRSA